MGSLEYLQRQLQKEYYSLTDGDKNEFYDESLIIQNKLKDYDEHRKLFDKVLSNYYYANVSYQMV